MVNYQGFEKTLGVIVDNTTATEMRLKGFKREMEALSNMR